MNVGLLGDLIEILHRTNGGYVTFDLDEVTIIVADKENADAMIKAVDPVNKDQCY